MPTLFSHAESMNERFTETFKPQTHWGLQAANNPAFQRRLYLRNTDLLAFTSFSTDIGSTRFNPKMGLKLASRTKHPSTGRRRYLQSRQLRTSRTRHQPTLSLKQVLKLFKTFRTSAIVGVGFGGQRVSVNHQPSAHRGASTNWFRLSTQDLGRSQAVDASYDFKAEGMFSANERRRWHGTKRECTVGDPGTTQTGFCKSPTCSICIAMQRSFDKEKSTPGSMFGKGVYTSGTSSKLRHLVTASYRVLAGKAEKLTQADHSLVAARAGFDSVSSRCSGGDLNDELIVYDNYQFDPYTSLFTTVLKLLAVSALFLGFKLFRLKTAPLDVPHIRLFRPSPNE
ncbi:hypothetical protein M407DRAFT_28246 [Tulasnella calospora MUT 4182]|uniref:Uncharacterized protein n=1 Tax=Tulasnella calospora MUT 4182 TaxID=1051891 RepID=A0A0C3LLK6_9AGAM|nr:hypothetical protein M407DRAFT_28246 [Tulasnella calospora MUT 4182]